MLWLLSSFSGFNYDFNEDLKEKKLNTYENEEDNNTDQYTT